jgi:hypothetical protein
MQKSAAASLPKYAMPDSAVISSSRARAPHCSAAGDEPGPQRAYGTFAVSPPLGMKSVPA